MNTNKWNKEFDKDYDINNIDEWTLGIVASTLTHEKLEPSFSDASHITIKLRSLVEKAIKEAKEETVKNIRMLGDVRVRIEDINNYAKRNNLKI